MSAGPATAGGTAFDRRFAEWLEARVALERHAGNDAERDALMVRLDDAARAAAATPATTSWAVWRKFEILERALYGDGEDASTSDLQHVWIVAGIKADILALGIGDDAAVRA